MVWSILGAGAIGQLFATRFIDAKIPIRLLLRDAILEDYYQLHRIQGKETRHYQLPVDPADASMPIKYLLICTKAPDTLNALKQYQHRISPEADIVLLQNGMGQHEQVQAMLPKASIWAGITTAGAWRDRDHHTDLQQLHCVSEGVTEIGCLSRTSVLLPPGLENCDPKINLSSNISLSLWRKLAINCAINPLTAIHQCLNGELVKKPELLANMQQVCEEIEQLFARLELHLFDKSVFETAKQIAIATGDNRSSMLTDRLNKRPTEIDYITGHICRTAKQVGIGVPFNQQLLSDVKKLSSIQCHVTLDRHSPLR